jgi:CheY-like chemotaxis protein
MPVGAVTVGVLMSLHSNGSSEYRHRKNYRDKEAVMSSAAFGSSLRYPHPISQLGMARSLLLVDDDDLSLTLVAERLTAAGYDVTTSNDATQACEMLRQQSFPLVMTDYRMPTMNGAELVKRVREQVGDESYCIMWTMSVEDADRAQSFAMGVDDHVSKRVSDRELLARVEQGFKAVERRQALRLTRSVFEKTGSFKRYQMDSDDSGRDAYHAAASHLHAEMDRALRAKTSVCVLMLHIERGLAPNDESAVISAPHSSYSYSQVNELVATIQRKVRRGLDWALPLETESGIARIMVVLPETSSALTAPVRERIAAAIAESMITDEHAELVPECAVGVAVFDGSVSLSRAVVNAAVLIAQAESNMERLQLPLM